MQARTTSLLLVASAALVLSSASSPIQAAEDSQALEDALLWEEILVSDLEIPRDSVLESAPPGEAPWRTSSAAEALRSPGALEELARQSSEALSSDIPRTGLPSWTALFELARRELSPTEEPSDPDCGEAGADADLSTQILAAEQQRGVRRSRREQRELRDSLGPALDQELGRLTSQAQLAACRLQAALSELDSPEREAAVAAAELMLDPFDRGPDELAAAAAVLQVAWEQADGPSLLLAGEAWSTAVGDSVLRLSALPAEAWPSTPRILSTELGEIWIGSVENNSGTGDPFLLVDPGGDDHWRIAPSREALPPEGLRAVRGWIDLAGDDRWDGGVGAAGGALFSVAAGVDAGGNDSHRSGRLGAGAAVLGSSTWLDLQGADRYEADGASQGMAAFGIAALRDVGQEADSYRAGGSAQAVALAGGVGVLQDSGGDDHYVLTRASAGGGQARARGELPSAGGGIALLIDEAGDDRYEAEALAQGSCDAHGVAILVDRGGEDRWSSGSWSQGSASRECAAVLLEERGNDRFTASDRAQAWAGWGGLALLIDTAGDDRYLAELSAQASSDRNGTALLIDRAGEDSWQAKGAASQGPGSADGSRLAVLQDLAEPGYLLLLDAPEPATEEWLFGTVPGAPEAATLAELRATASDLGSLGEALQRSAELAEAPSGALRAAGLDVLTTAARFPELTLDPQDQTTWESRAVLALSRDPAPQVRLAALLLLEAIGGPGVASALAEALASGAAAERHLAEQALASLATRSDGLAVARAVFPLASGEDSASSPVRAAALRVLAASRHHEAWTVIEESLAAPKPLVRRGAAQAATILGGGQARAALEARRSVEEELRVLEALTAGSPP